MSETKKMPYPRNVDMYKNDPSFYEELTLLKAQEKIAELMENNNVSKAELAKRLNQSKAHVTELLSEGRNLTLKTFARVCFCLNAEIDFQTYLIGKRYSIKKSFVDNPLKKRSEEFFVTQPDDDSLEIDFQTYSKIDYKKVFSNLSDNQNKEMYNMDQLQIGEIRDDDLKVA